jgi:hypothetical protein
MYDVHLLLHWPFGQSAEGSGFSKPQTSGRVDRMWAAGRSKSRGAAHAYLPTHPVPC